MTCMPARRSTPIFDNGLTALFIPFEMPRDLSATQLCVQAMTTPYHIVDTPPDVQQTIALLKKMKMVCAMRLHALVFAASAGVPFIATSYDIKVNGFMEYIENEACCDLNQLTAQWLVRPDRSYYGRRTKVFFVAQPYTRIGTGKCSGGN